MDRSQSSSPDFVAEMQRRRDEMKAICANVKVVYDGGAPLFTKSAIQDFSMQLERFKEGPEDCQLRLTGIDGVSVDIYVHKTKDTHWEESFSEESETKTYCINSQSVPRIHYLSMQELTRYRHAELFVPKEAYLSLGFFISPPAHDAAGFSVEDLVQILNDAIQEWKATEQNNRLRRLLCSEPVLSTVDKVIGIACGELVFKSQVRPEPAIQHALLLSIRDHLSENRECAQIQCYSQEPAYSTKEKQALKEVEITVLEDPEAFLEVDDTSIIVSIGANVPVKQIITEIARPAAIIWWKEVDKDTESIRCTDPSSRRVQKMLNTEYIELEFPYHPCTRDVALYVRRQEPVEEKAIEVNDLTKG